jgi:hypothetical protein
MGRGGAVHGKTLSPPKRNLTRPKAGDTLKFDGLVKSPSAALRFNFVAAVHL